MDAQKHDARTQLKNRMMGYVWVAFGDQNRNQRSTARPLNLKIILDPFFEAKASLIVFGVVVSTVTVLNL